MCSSDLEVLRRSDSQGYARSDKWLAGQPSELPVEPAPRRVASGASLSSILGRAQAGDRLTESQIATLFQARADDFHDDGLALAEAGVGRASGGELKPGDKSERGGEQRADEFGFFHGKFF